MRRATTDVELEALVSVHNAVNPREPLGVPEMRSKESQVAEMRFWVAWEGERPVGAAHAALRVQSPEPHAEGGVLEDERRRGTGSKLYETVSEFLRSRGKDGMEVPVWDWDPDGEAFVRNRGFTEIGRELRVSLDLTKIDGPEVEPPPGVTIMTWAERPELIHGIYEVALEALVDIPGQEDEEVEPFEDWVAHEMASGPGDRPEATFVALAQDEVVAYAKLSLSRARPVVAMHDITGVRRAWRGRGIARALKAAEIAWAKEAGFERLETQNEERNEPIRRLNERYGYVVTPGSVTVRGRIR
jgi:GNAT superfamily N-acetyltransferase